MAARKIKPADFDQYSGGNGRVDKALRLYRSGKLKTGESHLDVGGAIGDLGYALRKENLFQRTIVLDISAQNLQAAQSKGNVTCLSDVDTQGFKFEVDAISALDFIEHIIDPENFARLCFQSLRPGGEVFINTPNIQFWKHQEQLRVEGRFPHTSGDREVYHGGHLAFFTYLDLLDIFHSAGFKEFEQIKDDEGFQYPADQNLYPMGRNQNEFVQMSLRVSCPNLLFRARRP